MTVITNLEKKLKAALRGNDKLKERIQINRDIIDDSSRALQAKQSRITNLEKAASVMQSNLDVGKQDYDRAKRDLERSEKVVETTTEAMTAMQADIARQAERLTGMVQMASVMLSDDHCLLQDKYKHLASERPVSPYTPVESFLLRIHEEIQAPVRVSGSALCPTTRW